MNKLVKLFFTFNFLIFAQVVVFAQCPFGGSQYPANTFSNPGSAFVTVSTCIYGGEYQLYSVVSGTTYDWSYCSGDGAATAVGDDLQLTLFNNTTGTALAYEDDVCGNAPKITWTANFTGIVRVLTNLFNCATNSTCHTLSWRGVAGNFGNGCSSGNSFSSFTVTCPSNQVSYAQCTFAGEYNSLTLTAGTLYTFGSNIGSDYITVTNAANTILTSGTQPISFTPTSSAVYRVYIHVNSACVTASDCRDPWVSCSNSSSVSSPTSISGTPSICQGGNSTLTVNGSSGTTYWFTGSCGSSIATSIGSGTSINVSPTVPTTYYARNYNNGIWSTNCAIFTVTVGAAPSNPSNPTSNSPQCNSVTITRAGTPPAGVTWYWQGTNANGTSTALGSGATYTATATGTYYIRALNSSGCWSSGSGGIAVVIGGQPANPSNPTSNSPQCNSITITRVGTPPAGTTWYWQGTNANGTSTALGSGATYTATTSGTYYIRALNSNGCWSSGSGSVTVTIGGQPSNPSNPTSNSPQCNSVTLTRVGTPPAGTTWYWQGTNANGTSTTLGSGTTYTATASGTYYIRAMNNSGCWSTGSGSIAVTLGGPADPSNPTSNSPQCNSITITRVGTPPAGTNWYWQGTNANGTSTALGAGTTFVASTSGTYYIRALNASGCWSSGSGSVTVTISGIPSTPANPTSNSPQCNSATITRVGNPPAGATWYWQGTNAFGTSTTLGSGPTYTAATSGTYYLRSLSGGGCWSDASGSVAVTVLPEPSNPTNPTSNSPQCNLVTLTRSGLPPTGVNWYWQGTTANGTSTTLGSGATYSATSTGTYYLRALNQSGCWSSGSGLVAVTINPSYTVSELIVACGSYTWINGVTYTESTATPSFNLQTAQGCDSLIYLDLTIGQPQTDSTYIQTSAIGSYTLNGTTYTESGVYYQTLNNQFGCDSTVVLDLVFDFSVLISINPENELMLFPNPSTDGIFNILMPEEAAIIAITDVKGKLIKYAYLDGKLNVPQVTGIYFLTVKHLDRLQTYKMVVM